MSPEDRISDMPLMLAIGILLGKLGERKYRGVD